MSPGLPAALTALLLGVIHAPARTEESRPALRGIDHLTINVPDLARSEAWYTRTLGFEVTSRNDQYLMLKQPGITLVLSRATSPGSNADAETRPGYFHVAFTVDGADIRALVEALRRQGTTADVVTDGDVQQAYFQDPDGNWLELFAHAPDAAVSPAAAITWLADVLLGHLEATSLEVRSQRLLPTDRLPDLGADAARREAEFSRRMLERLDRIPVATLTHAQQSLAGVLRHAFRTGASAGDDYWYTFAVTPYAGARAVQEIHGALAEAPLATAADRGRLLKLIDDYTGVIKALREKTLAQAARGIRVPQPELPVVAKTLAGLRAGAVSLLTAAGERGAAAGGTADHEFSSQVQQRVAGGVLPAWDALIAVFDDDYTRRAPAKVGVGQYAGGREYYRRRIFAETGLTLEPRAIHELGLRRVAELDQQLARIRAEVGFHGSRDAFHAMLRTDPRFLATTPAEVEARYQSYLDRVTPLLPKYFAVVPRTPYGVTRLDPAAEPGMTYGFYGGPTATEPRGLYHYNGSNLASRSLVTAAHLIYRELVPGHHLHLALSIENSSLHPVEQVLAFGADTQGWAEYGAQLAVEMGAFADPYDLYGHLCAQAFLASRLVVDTGMNDLGWSLERARQFMREHTFESDAQIASETLRYSVDIPGQALAYRLGYETFLEGRRRAEQTLGGRFDLRAFNTAMSNRGAMPLDVIDRHVDWFIAHSAALK